MKTRGKAGLLARVLLLCALLLAGAGCGGRPGRLCVQNGRLSDTLGRPVQLRGVSTHGIAWYPEYLNANAFRSVKEAGGNCVRA